MAFTAVVGLATYGGAAATGVAVMTAMTYVGIALTVVGTVTKDKQLMKTGGLLSLVGGVGGAMGGAGLAGEAAAGAGEAAVGEVAAGEATGLIDAGTGAPALEAGATLAEPTATNALTQLSGPADGMAELTQPGAEVAKQTTADIAKPGVAVSEPAPLPDSASQSLKAVQGEGLGVNGPAEPVTPNGPADVAQGGPIPSDTFYANLGKFWDGLGPQGKGMAIQQVGGAFAGMAETEKHNELMDYRNRELALRSHGSAVAKYRRPGLINAPKG